ncbi:unnamed protein product [Brassicogethes aeneus]|uniref:Uncharacterized protein n=1 Tax=Brassicogethes aeneus TaxID=1431903 RepID=A0A9P0FCK1_BRAAE|nr:unnamed protein product [Brassicogethes aeneus]
MMPEAFSIHQSLCVPSSPPSPKPRRALPKNYSQVNVNNNNNNRGGNFKRGCSFVVGQKLRESKWFGRNETNVFCAVVESGFIVEKNVLEKTLYGIVLWTPGNEKSKNPEHIKIVTLLDVKGKPKVSEQNLEDFWPEETNLRINNKNDKTESPLTEECIRNQVSFALTVSRKWHNSEHLAYFCRYGPVETRKVYLKWTTNAFFRKIKSFSVK